MGRKLLYDEDNINDTAIAIQKQTGSTDKLTTADFADAILKIGEKPLKDVNFYDYDGTCVDSYTLSEFQALTEMPVLPDHTEDGLINEGWNWTLAQAKAVHGPLAIGCNYVTDDGKTRFYLDVPVGGLTYYLKMATTVAEGAVINWGDGTADETSADSTSITAYDHTYAEAGKYVLTVDNTANQNCSVCFGIPGNTLLAIGHDNNVNANTDTTIQSMSLYKIECGNRVKFGRSATYNTRVETITFTRDGSQFTNFTNNIYNMFTNSISLKAVILPPNLGWVGSNDAFANCGKLKVISLGYDTSWSTWYNQQPQTRTQMKDIISPRRFFNTGSLGDTIFGERLVIADNIFACSYYMGNNDRAAINLKEIYMLKQYVVPAYNAKFVNSITKVYVPQYLYNEWIATTGWSDMASRIIPVDVPLAGTKISPDVSEFTPDKRINWQDWNPPGAEYDQTDYSLSPFIEINPGDRIYYYFTSNCDYICTYDANKNGLRGILSHTIKTDNDLMSVPYVIPDGVKYIRFAFGTSALNSNPLLGLYKNLT